jgi:hypothetical protein
VVKACPNGKLSTVFELKVEEIFALVLSKAGRLYPYH